MLKKALLRKLLFNLWKQSGGCVSCAYEKENNCKVEKQHHQCSVRQDERIEVKTK